MKRSGGRRVVHRTWDKVPARGGKQLVYRDLSVVVTPLQPPFTQDWVRISLSGLGKDLALSRIDAEQVKALMRDGDLVGQSIVLEANGDKIRISAV